MASRYFVGSGTNSSSTASWSATSGGASGATVPTAADDVHLDANSPGNLTLDASLSCLSFDCTGFTHTLTHNGSVTLTVAGGTFKLVPGMTYTLGSVTSSAIAFTQSSAGTVSIDTGGKNIGNVTTASGLTVSSASYQLVGSTTLGATASWIHNAGTFDTNSQAFSVGLFQSNSSNTRTILFGSSTVTLTGAVTSTVWNTNTITGLTFTPGTSTVSLTGAFTGAGGTFGGGGLTFNNLTSTATGTWLLNGGNTFNTVTITGVQTVNFRRSTTTTVQNFIVWGSSGNVIVLQSDLAGTQWTLACSSRLYIWLDWVSLKDAKTSGTTVFFAGADSTNVSNNTGWTFANWGMSGTAASTTTASGVLTTSAPLSGSATSTTAVSGSIRTTAPLSGSMSASSSVTGSVVQPAIRLFGTMKAKTTVAGTICLPSKPIVSVRERPPIRLHVSVDVVGRGTSMRWADDEPDPSNGLGALTFSDSNPGGFEQASGNLVRKAREWADLRDLETITIRGVGGDIAWQGRLDQRPEQSGDQLGVSPQAVGFQAHLDDDNSVRMIPIDRDFSAWQGSSIQRKLDLYGLGIDVDDPTTTADQTTGQPALETGFSGAWARTHVTEAWYDAADIPLSELWVRWKPLLPFNLGSPDPNFSWTAYLLTDDVASSFDNSTALEAAIMPGWPGYGDGFVGAHAVRKWAMLQLLYTGASGNDGQNYAIDWIEAIVKGDHSGITFRGTFPDFGVFASDVIAYGLQRWAPKIGFTLNPNPGFDDAYSIQQSEYSISHLPFKTATTMSDVVKQSIRFELPDWFIWEGPTMFMNKRDARAKRWQARSGPAKLQNAGPQAANLWNGVIVNYTDVTGIARTAGPPGSGSDVEDARLFDADPQNPVTLAGYNRFATVAMGTSVPGAAIQVGAVFLAQQKEVISSGTAVLTGHVQDDHGIWWPAWMVRSGDLIRFIDASDTSYRRIIRKEWDGSSKAAAISLDAPPDTMQQLLERLALDLLPLGLS